MWRLAFIAAGCLIPLVASAQAPRTRTCVQVTGAGDDTNTLEDMVRWETDRHATHVAATERCETTVRIERFDIGTRSYLTGRMNNSVPHREEIVEGDVARSIERLLRVLFNNDPVRMRGPRRFDALRQRLKSLKAGRMVYGIEAFQLVALVDDDPQSVAGIAVNVRREVDFWQIGGRLHYGGRFDGIGDDLTLVGHLAVQLNVMWFTHPNADWSVYFGTVAGLDHQRYEGPSGVDGGPSSTSASLFAVGGRLGVELFRATTGRADVFAQFMAPVGTTTDDQDLVIDAWVPSATMGFGVAF